MALPGEGKKTGRSARGELRRAQRHMVLATGGGRARHVAVGEERPGRIGARARIGDERVLADARRPHDRGQTAAHRPPAAMRGVSSLASGAASPMVSPWRAQHGLGRCADQPAIFPLPCW
jgi:hypothetical protein